MSHLEPRPTFGDVRDTLVNLPHGDPWGGASYCQLDLFTVRFDLIRRLEPQPTSVFECGALYGYFLVTALEAAPTIRRVGWVDNESHSPGSNLMCLENLASLDGAHELDGWVSFYTWRGDIPPSARYDLVSVDSDHSYDGCLADLRAAHKLEPSWIFVDDWIAGAHGDDIRAATTAFLLEADDAYTVTEHTTVNGLAVLTRRTS